jgi:hypothetical protein
MREVWSPRAPFLGRFFEMKSSPRLSVVLRPGSEPAKLCPREEGSGGLEFRAARTSARRSCPSQRGVGRCGEELRPLRRIVPEEGDPAVRDNARDVTLIRMARLRSASSVFQKGSLHARPRVSHL